ncbi:MAG TPA: hypothetical protein DCQ20_09485 [Nitrospira sp.]|jgi:hypothetical protein|nr:hypothetical protein [Nitrospira sp.]
MKPLKSKGVKQKVVVTIDEHDGTSTVVLYRGGRTGLAFRTPDHRVFREAAQQSRGGDAAISASPASAAMTSQQGGSR